MNKDILKLTERAKNRVKLLIKKSNGNVLGIRIGVKTAGCSGMKYHVEYASDIKPFEEKIKIEDLTILIDPAAVMFLVGSTMDYQENKFSSGFEFSNPNEIARCGCGESFSVQKARK